MSSTKQNLFIFFEENAWPCSIHSNLLHLSMNRFVIDEDSQFEVIKIYNFKFVKKEMVDSEHPEYKNHAKERTEKEAFDKDLISEALDEAIHHQKHAETHFIFGTYFYRLEKYDSHQKPRSKLLDWISQERIQSGLQSLHCTFYSGSRLFLISKSVYEDCYENKMGLFLTSDSKYSRHIQSLEQAPIVTPDTSINDDLEDLIDQIQNGDRPINSKDSILFMNKMLTRKELKQVEDNDMAFWQTLGNDGENSTEHKKFNKECDKDEDKNKYVYCPCIRYTELLK